MGGGKGYSDPRKGGKQVRMEQENEGRGRRAVGKGREERNKIGLTAERKGKGVEMEGRVRRKKSWRSKVEAFTLERF